ncbi:hypothetical protein [Pseudomonas sp. Irchel 3E19]|uniref:hypothetical protein n=1 Tax=Pseudomonas sp. Irchel 3E19 TaxID=2008981 RepID=UPI000BA342DB|nr:hypothetical protein [Pseudomonas sp. Irchel 3E19]
MEFLRFLAFVAAWGFMWRWVVKNRGSWHLFYGNIVGAAGGFIVAMVVLSITLSLFPSAPAQTYNSETESAAAALMPELERAMQPTPVIASTPAQSDNLATYVASAPQNEPSPPESALLPNYSKRLPVSLLEKDFKDNVHDDFTASRRLAGTHPDADKSMMALMICEPFIKSAMRFSASTAIASAKSASSQRFKDQTYTISSTVSALNMLGDTVSYGFDCSVQQVDGKDTDKAAWRLLDLKFKKRDS